MIRRTSRILVEVLAALVAGLVLLVGLAVWRMGEGEPIRLNFLTSYLERALTAPDGSITVHIDKTLLTWAGWDRTFDIRAKGIRARGSDGRTIAAIPEISVSLSVRALLHGQVAPTAIDIFRPRLYLRRDEDGRFRFGRPAQAGEQAADGQADESEAEGEASSIFPGLLAEILAPPDRDRATGYLRSASIIDGNLVYLDRRIGIIRRAPDADIVIRRTPRGLAGELVLAVEQRGDAPARLRADVSYVRLTDRFALSARFAGVAATAFAELDPALAALEQAKLTFQGRFVTTIGLNGAIGESSLDLAAGPGTLPLPGLSDEPLRIQHLTMAGRLESGGDRLKVTEAVLQLEKLGAAAPRLTLTGSVTGLAASHLPGISGRTGTGRTLRVAGRATAADVPTEMLERYWPRGVARGARNWVTDNIESGMVEHAEANFALRLPDGGNLGGVEVETLNGAFSAVGLTVHYLKPMPPLRDVSGIGSFTDREFVADVHGGGVEGLSIESGRVRITKVEDAPEVVEIDGQVHGSLPDALRLLDHPRLGYPSKLGLAPTDTMGDASARLSFRFPAVKHLSFDQVEIGVAAEVAGAELRGVMFDRDVKQGSFTVDVTNENMTVAGAAVIGGVPAEIHWVENFSGEEAFRSRIAVSGTVDAAQRAAFGLDFRPYLEGPVPTKLLLTRYEGERTLVSASFDLGSATIDLPFIAWSKPAGEPGTADLVLELKGEHPVAISDLTVTAGSLSAKGQGRFGAADGSLRSIRLDTATFGQSALKNVAFDFSDDRIDVAIGGGLLDAEPLLAGGQEGDKGDEGSEPEGEDETAVTLTAGNLQEVRLGPDRAITDVSALLEHDGAHWERIRIEGTLPGGHPMSLHYEPADPGRHKLTVSAEDAGAALRAFNVIGNVEGGRLRITAMADDSEPQRPLQGKAEISEFRLVGAPALARLLTVATLTGLVDVLTGEGFLFTRFIGEFTKTGGVLDIPLARAYGPSIGLTAQGKVDLDADTLDLEGTIVPAYAINNLLANIPVVGDILQGGKGEGIFAATYKASGSLADPRITVNPLAALAPGFLRGLFDIFDADSGERSTPRALPEPGSNR